MLKRSKSRRLQWMVLGGVIILSGALVAGVTWPVRAALREQILRSEAGSMAAVARLQRDLGAERYRELGIEPTAIDTFEALLESAQLEGVVALQLYNPDGVGERELPLLAYVKNLGEAKQVLEPFAKLHGEGTEVRGAGDALAGLAGPWLEVIVPLFGESKSAPESWARYWIDGRNVASEWAEIDRQLLRVAGWSGGIGAVTLALVLLWAFSRLQRQADDLARTNRDLLLYNKTAAIGAISSHLIHGLKNPLAGLEGFMAVEPQADGSDDRGGAAWGEAVETTRRARRMINEVLEVLRETEDEADYMVPVDEVIEAAWRKVGEAAKKAGVVLINSGKNSEFTLRGNRASLTGLVLHNLLDNAISATPQGGEVRLAVGRGTGGAMSIEVRDTGAGLPDLVQQANFSPVVSAKNGGAGLGLALSYQLARHAGGHLRVVSSGETGTCFGLELPTAVEAKPEYGGLIK